jgi:hypothetical protein
VAGRCRRSNFRPPLPWSNPPAARIPYIRLKVDAHSSHLSFTILGVGLNTPTSTSTSTIGDTLERFYYFAPLTMHQPEEIDPDYEPREDPEYEALQETVSRGIKAARQKRLGQERAQKPAIAYDIPKALYGKARKHQDQLTDAERQLLLSRGDLVGKALAQPSTLTSVERNIVLKRLPIDTIHENTKSATNGELTTIDELVAKARADIASLNEAEVDLLANNFNIKAVPYNPVPGTSEALEVLMSPVEKEAIFAARDVRMAQRERKRPLPPAEIPSYSSVLGDRLRPDVRGQNPPFLFYSMEQWDKVRENPGILKSDLNKILEDQWSAMTEEAQAPYEKERATWNRKYGMMDNLHRHRMAPNSEVPNPPLIYFGTENWDKAREENPHVREAPALRKVLEDQWNAMTPEERAPYEEGYETHTDRWIKARITKAKRTRQK